jgi:hypothetical protein
LLFSSDGDERNFAPFFIQLAVMFNTQSAVNRDLSFTSLKAKNNQDLGHH